MRVRGLVVSSSWTIAAPMAPPIVKRTSSMGRRPGSLNKKPATTVRYRLRRDAGRCVQCDDESPDRVICLRCARYNAERKRMREGRAVP